MPKKPTKHAKATQTVHASHAPLKHHGMANIPVYHTSTVMKATMADYREGRGAYDYGRVGTPTSEAVEAAVAELYGYDDCVATPSGLSAIGLAIAAMVATGDEVLLPDSMYGSGRRFCENVLPAMGVKPVFYDPLLDEAGMRQRITGATRLVYIESPGSLGFEMQDIPGIVAAGRGAGVATACDNTWGTALHFDAKAAGIDIVVEAGTKYIAGHSDASIGFVLADGEVAKRIRGYARWWGLCVAADEHYLALRGMRTLAVRLKQSAAGAVRLAEWLEGQPEVIAMFHPALPSHPQHAAWQRDFTGSAGLFAFVLDSKLSQKAVDACVDGLALFGIGASWGGHESLISQRKPKRAFATPVAGYWLRVYVGLEDADDLIADLEAGFQRLRKS